MSLLHCYFIVSFALKVNIVNYLVKYIKPVINTYNKKNIVAKIIN